MSTSSPPNAKGQITWERWIKVPYVGMIHDFAVTQKYIAFLVIPMATNVERMKQGQVHFAWDSTLPTWFGVLERGGDGKDVRWFKGPERCATHVMGAFSDGNKIYVDMDMAPKNQFPFFPNLHGEPFDPKAASGTVHRLSVDLSDKTPRDYSMEELYPQSGALPRQDDRYQTIPYKIGFMPTSDPTKPLNPKLGNMPFRPTNSYTHVRPLHAQDFANSGSATIPACRNAASFRAARTPPEGDGYLVGVANRLLEGGRSDLVIVDTQHHGGRPRRQSEAAFQNLQPGPRLVGIRLRPTHFFFFFFFFFKKKKKGSRPPSDTSSRRSFARSSRPMPTISNPA